MFLKVLQILTQDTTPSSELISTVKRLYETKHKVRLTAKSIVELSTNAYIFGLFTYLDWFSIAGCVNSCSTAVIAFQKRGQIDKLLLLVYAYS